MRGLWIGVASVAIATALLLALQQFVPQIVNVAVVALVYLAIININLQISGVPGGFVVTAVSVLLLNVLFIEPRFSLLVGSIADLVLLLGFLVVAVVNSRLVFGAQRRRIEAELRERNATRFYAFMLELINAHDASVAARALEQRLTEDLPAQRVAVYLYEAGSPPAHAVQPTRVEVIQSARGRLGEVHIWADANATINEQLLRTYAGEVALILERMRLAESDTRAQVLERSDRLKGALLSSVSHELRTPLAAITAGAESLTGGPVQPDSPEGRETLEDVRASAMHLSQLVNNLLDMSRIESGSLHPQREWADLGDIVSGSLGHLRGELAHHNVQVQLPNTLPLLAVDAVQMDQVFTNLLVNASKYAPPNTRIAIGAQPVDDDWVRVTVENESPQVAAGDLERMFDKFQRVTQPQRVLGTGLGLSICKGIVEAHGGRLWAENRPNASIGMRFCFTLPCMLNGARPAQPPAET